MVAGFRSEVMVGRERELKALREVAARVRVGEPAAALVLGEAGVGKTRLVTELVTELDADAWLCPISHGVALAGGELPFGGTIELLRALVRTVGIDEVRRVLGSQTVVLAPLLPALGRVETSLVDRAAVLGAVLSLLEGLDRPVAWLVDDLQWVDAHTQDLVTYLSRVLAEAPVLLLGTVRTAHTAPADLPEELAAIGRIAHAYTLASLTPEQVAEQVRGTPGAELAQDAVARICAVSDGLPFFVEQLVASGGQLTGSVRSVVLSGFRALSPQTRALLSAAAVGEGLLVPAYLREVTGLAAAFDGALAEALESGMLRPVDRGELLRFRHALLREVLDADLMAEQRRELHLRWARHIEHLMATQDHEPRLVMERARHRYAVGGDDALPAVLAAAEAVEFADDESACARWWARVLELWPRPDMAALDRDLALCRYVYAMWGLGASDVLAEVLVRELDGETDWLRGLWLRVALAQAQSAMQISVASVVPPEDAEATVERLLSFPPDFRVTWLLVYLVHEWFLDHPHLAEEMLEQALERADPATDTHLVHSALHMLGWIAQVFGDPNDEVALAERAVDWSARHHPSTLLRARYYVTFSLSDVGRYREAASLAEDNLKAIRDPLLYPQLWVLQHLTLGKIATCNGDWDRAAACLTLADTDACVGELAAARNLLWARLAGRAGRNDDARRHRDAIQEAPDEARIGYEWSQGSIHRADASLEVAAATGDTAAARSSCRRMFELIHPHDPPDELWECAVVALRVAVDRSGLDQSSEFLASVEDGLATRNPRGRLIGACRGEIDLHGERNADSDTPEGWAVQADRWTELDRPYDAAWCWLFEAQCALRDGNRERARKSLTEAWQTCDRLGAVPLRELVEATARRGRIDGVGERDTAAGLTVRETEVLALIAEGRTNAEIAETLYMSPKTASVHVSHIIAKLGVANRTEAAALAHRRGLVPRPT